jgi:mRNA interferase HigB
LHVISRKKLLDAVNEHGGIDGPLDSWYRIAKSAEWRNIGEVRQIYPHADGVRVGSKVYTVFNISGNRFRLVTEVFYEDRTILISHVLTHAEYDKGTWKK